MTCGFLGGRSLFGKETAQTCFGFVCNGRPTWLFESSGPLLEGYGKPFGLWRYERWAVSKLPSQDSPCSRHQVCSPWHHLKLQGICKSHGTSISHVLRVLPFRVVKPPRQKKTYTKIRPDTPRYLHGIPPDTSDMTQKQPRYVQIHSSRYELKTAQIRPDTSRYGLKPAQMHPDTSRYGLKPSQINPDTSRYVQIWPKNGPDTPRYVQIRLKPAQIYPDTSRYDQIRPKIGPDTTIFFCMWTFCLLFRPLKVFRKRQVKHRDGDGDDDDDVSFGDWNFCLVSGRASVWFPTLVLINGVSSVWLPALDWPMPGFRHWSNTVMVMVMMMMMLVLVTEISVWFPAGQVSGFRRLY